MLGWLVGWHRRGWRCSRFCAVSALLRGARRVVVLDCLLPLLCTLRTLLMLAPFLSLCLTKTFPRVVARAQNMGAAYGTAKSGVGVASMGVMRPDMVMRSIIPVVMAGIIGIYGLI